MPYQYAIERRDYSDYASGRVFYSLPGCPAFPVRLASEIFQRCLAIRGASGHTGPCVLYDPCCGGAYLLSTLAYLHWHDLEAVLGSDVDGEALALAERNLGLLTPAGLARRRAEVAGWLVRYGKQAHVDALASIERFGQRLEVLVKVHPVQRRLFRADATDAQALVAGLQGTGVDVVIADVPYGEHTAWRRPDGQILSEDEAGWRMLDALRSVVSTNTVVAVAARKGRAVEHPGYQRYQRLRLGKRLVDFFVLQQAAVGQEGRCCPRS